ncbi:hypothetical protein [Bradyrhizobium sp. CCBAU 051011]|uniref:hypothetical protein n=1 Tax=Bradyrhizobium sp. CCBAU 051011 TaxID=858422 RepID=UPI00192A40E2|nr:hypothetical protein [Bradyrhizobium sp. CCBAU 051011]
MEQTGNAGARKMAMIGPAIEALIGKAFPMLEVSVTYLGGEGDHCGARVIQRAFTVKSQSSIRLCMRRSTGQWVQSFTTLRRHPQP